MHPSADLAIVILAGGEATRLPGKLAKPAGEVPLLVRVYRNLESAGHPVYLSLKEPLAAPLAAPLARCSPIYDAEPERGPVGGLLSVFASIPQRYAFVCAGDAPLVGVDHLERMLAAWREGDQAVLGTPPSPDEREDWVPLPALFDAPAFLRTGRAALQSGRGSLRAAIEHLRMRVLPMDEAAFVNVNTPAEYAAFLERLS